MEFHQTTSSDITVLDNGTVLTSDGLALKGTDAVEIINVRLENRKDALFFSWQMCRAVRRDFNFVTTKLFHRERRKGGRDQVRDLLQEVRLQAELLVIECESFDSPPEAPGRSVPLRLFSATGAGLFKSFQMADSAYAKLNHAVEKRELAENMVHAFTNDFEAAFSDLKLYCSTRNQQVKSARELADAEGVA